MLKSLKADISKEKTMEVLQTPMSKSLVLHHRIYHLKKLLPNIKLTQPSGISLLPSLNYFSTNMN